ncbi:glycosyltransferase family 4 protein [Pseudomonas sp. MF6747]|uniref:glycosyltransferase family 4 protein n=1 Tax=Pseudomonas sp. MF6747 TaxID=2797527 RepID=UPI00190C3730|nr:glycosyltransferase family 1 protein [Pseudomonas sp. MF6747]MBK3505880.1 glycosyltransferase family 4 protein [Pseudomonas sp. MF6747]
MRIVIDLQGAQSESRFRGIGRYSLSLALAIAKNAGDHEIWIVLNARMPESILDIRNAFSALIPKERIRIFDVPDDLDSPWVLCAAEIVREEFIRSLEPDVVLISSLFEDPGAGAVTSVGAIANSHKTAVVLYDLIPLLNKDVYLPTQALRDYYSKKIGWLERADALLAISQSSSDEAVEYLNVSRENVPNISAAIGAQFYPRVFSKQEADKFLQRMGVQEKFVLYAPGGFDPRKNFARLLEAYSRLKPELRSHYQLVIASRLHEQQRIELLDLKEKFGFEIHELVLTGYVEDEDLIALYSLTSLFVFPSTHEGFGLPVLEAMACGAPVIGSNCSSVPEVIGLDEALFDPLSVASISDKISEVLKSDSLRQRLVKHAEIQAAKFSWDESALKAIAALEQVVSEVNPIIQYEFSQQALLENLGRLPDARPTDSQLVQVAKSIAFNMLGGAEKQLLLDVSSIVQSDAKSGIQRVVRSLLQELFNSPPAGLVVRPIFYRAGGYFYANEFVARVFSASADGAGGADAPIDYVQGDIYLSLDLTMHLADELYPLHAQMRSAGVDVNFIVYDLLLVQRPDWWPAPTADYFTNWLKRITDVGAGLICISEAVAQELREWIANNPPARCDGGPHVKSFHLGADIASSMPSIGFPKNAQNVLAQLQARPSFLMVSTIEPRKGHAQTIAAFETLWAEDVDANLVIVGKRGWLVDSLISAIENHPALNVRLFWLEGISDEYLEKVYGVSTCLIAASEGEGFGLPLIEAAQHHVPMIARDIPVFREVAGDHAFYFEGLAPNALAQCVREWLVLFNAGEHPLSVNMPWLTWEQSAHQLKHSIFQ